MRRGELENVLEQRQRCRRVREREKGVECDRVEIARDAWMPQQRLDLRREHQGSAAGGVVERLLAESIAREKELLPPLVPQGKREHAVQPGNALRPVFLV